MVKMQLVNNWKVFCGILFGFCYCVTGIYTQDARYGLIRISVNGSDQGNVQLDNSTKEFCFLYPSNLFKLPMQPEEKYYKLADATDVDVCNNDTTVVSDFGSHTLVLLQGDNNCSFSKYISYAQDSHAIGFFSNVTLPKQLNDSDGLEIFGAIGNITLGELKKFVNWRSDALLQVFTFDWDESFWSYSVVFLWLTACLCVAVGSLTGPYQDLQSTSSRQQILDGTGSTTSEPKNVQINFTVTLVMILVVFISATLLLLYFFYQYLVYFFMAIFCFASGRAMYEILNQIAHVTKLDSVLPRIRGCSLEKAMFAVISIAVPIIWFIFRHNEHIWILQDLLGICFCVHLIQTLRIPNLQMCAVLLSLLFIYDIFFVFITPYITPNGKSVMVEVATGGNTGETLPLLIMFPRASLPTACMTQLSYSLLGFGDIIVPGFLVCFAHSFDLIRGDKMKPYFTVTMIGYAIGLAMAFVALFLSQTGQPALLYIVPCTLSAISITGIFRRQFMDLWRGAITITEVEP